VANTLAALMELGSGHECHLFTNNRNAAVQPVPRGVEIHRLRGPGSKFGTVWLNTVIPRSDRVRSCDVFWAPLQIAPILLPRSVPVVLTVCDLVWKRYAETQAWDNRLIFPLLARRSLRRADWITAISESTRQELLPLIPRRAHEVEVVGMGVDSVLVAKAADGLDDALDTIGITDNEPFYLAVGTREPRKNLPYLFEIWAEARRRGTHLPPLYVVGAAGWGNEDRRIRQLLDSAEGRIRLLGFVPDSTLAVLYREAIALVYPTHYEGYGLPALEAAANGTPTVGNDIPVLREGPAAAGILLSLDDMHAWIETLARLARDEALRGRLGAAAKEIAAQSTWEKAARQMLDIFHRVAAH